MRKVFVILFIVWVLFPNSLALALTNGILASNLLGQYDQTSFTNPVPVYTKSGVNDGPNKFGFSGLEYKYYLDANNHRFFLPDLGNNRVLVYNLNTDNSFPDKVPDYVLGQSNFYTNTATTTQSSINIANGLAYDVANNWLFVAQSGANRVTVFDLSNGITNGMNASYVLGQADFTSSGAATTQAGMNSPRDLAYDATNKRLFLTEATNNRVTVYDLSDGITNGEAAINVLGQTDFVTSSSGLTQSKFNSPRALLYDNNNRLFVGDRSNHRVLVFDVTSITNGENAINVLGQADFTSNPSTSSSTVGGLGQTQGLAYDATNQRLFVTSSSQCHVFVYNLADGITNGEAAINVLGQTDFTTTSCSYTQAKFGSSLVRGLFYDASTSRLYVGDTNRVMVFDVASITDGENAVDLLGQYDQTSFTNPVPVYTKSGVNDGPNKFGLNGGPNGIVIDTTNHRLFVADGGNHRVLIYDLSTNNTLVDLLPDYVLGQANFYSNTSALTQSGMNSPRDLAFDAANNRLFVAETSNNRVLVFDVTSITNGENAVYVLGQSNFTSNNLTVTQSGMASPRGLFYDPTNQRLFVSHNSSSANRITVYDLSAGITNGMNASYVLGQADFTSSSAATTQAGMRNPRGMYFVSSSSMLFVSDEGNNRILVFNIGAGITNGMNASYVLGQADFTSSSVATTQSGFNIPQYLAYDDVSSRLFVSEEGNKRVLVFDVASITNGENAVNVLGQTDFTSNTSSTTQSGFGTARGISYVSSNNLLYVADETGNRILVFSLSTTPITVSAPTNYYEPGSTVLINITFSNPVVVTGTPTLSLNNGKTASYTGGTGTTNLTFSYTVSSGDFSTDLDYSSTTALSLNGGTIIGTNNNVADLTLPSPGASGSLSITSNVSVVHPAVVFIPTFNIGSTLTSQVIPENEPTTPVANTCPSFDEKFKQVLKLGVNNPAVKVLQQILNCKGYAIASSGPGSINNETTKFGSLTKKAVMKFQREHGLVVDGVVGGKTLLKLK